LASQLNAEWTLDASLGVGQSDITSKTTSLSSNLDSSRSFLSIGLTRAEVRGKWFLLYKSALSSSKDKVKAFTYADGQVGAASTTVLNQLKIGVHAIYNNPPISPFVAVYHMANDFSVESVSSVKPKEYSSSQQLQVGLNASAGPVYGALAYQVERGRSQWRVYGGIRF
jgi:hypothetical protein